jgi:hypothetical protein
VRWASSRPLRRALKLRRRIGAVEQLFGALPSGRRYGRIVAEVMLCERELIGVTAPIHAALTRRKGEL